MSDLKVIDELVDFANRELLRVSFGLKIESRLQRDEDRPARQAPVEHFQDVVLQVPPLLEALLVRFEERGRGAPYTDEEEQQRDAVVAPALSPGEGAQGVRFDRVTAVGLRVLCGFRRDADLSDVVGGSDGIRALCAKLSSNEHWESIAASLGFQETSVVLDSGETVRFSDKPAVSPTGAPLASAPTVVLLPNLCMPRQFWLAVLHQRTVTIPCGVRVILHDFVGSGQRTAFVKGCLNAGQKPPVGPEHQVADLNSVLDAMAIPREQKVDFVAVSLGTQVLLNFARAHPERVNKTVLISTLSQPTTLLTTRYMKVAMGEWTFIDFVTFIVADSSGASAEQAQAAEPIFAHYPHMLYGAAPPSLEAYYAYCSRDVFSMKSTRSGSARTLAAARIPTLLVHGIRDRLSDVAGVRAMEREFGDSTLCELRELEDFGHLMEEVEDPSGDTITAAGLRLGLEFFGHL